MAEYLRRAIAAAMRQHPLSLSGTDADTVADAALAGLDTAGHVVVARSDLVAYLNRGTGDVADEAAALNRLLAAAGIE